MRFAPALLVLLAALVLFLGLGDTGLLDDREARDAQVARELIQAHEALTPVYGHEPFFAKPILAYAPEVAVRLWTTDPDLRSRQLRAVLMLLLLLVTAGIGAQHFGARAGWFSAAVLATTLVVPVASRTDGTQVLGTLLAWVACSSFADSVFGHVGGRGLRLVVGYGALASAFVTAGPVPALWPLGGLALYTALARDRDGWRRIQPLWGLALVAGLALTWYGAMFERHGSTFLAHAPFFPYAGVPRLSWFAGPVLALSFLAIGFFPWSSLLPAAILHAGTWWRLRRRPAGGEPPRAPTWADPVARERREEGAAHFFIACFVMALVTIAWYPSPPLSAALAALPAAALLCGRFFDHLFESPDRLAAPIGRATLLLALFGSSGALLLAVLASRLRGPAPDLRLLATVLFVTSWLPFLANLVGRRRAAAALMLLPVAAGTPVATLRLLPAMESYLGAREVAEAMAQVSPPRAPLVLIEPAPPSLRLYGRRNLVLATPREVPHDEHRAADGLVYVAFRPSREPDVARAAAGPIEVILRTPTLVLARLHAAR